jgi:large subunit ribosomal protein L24e
MPQTRDCNYCGSEIEAGTGTMLVRKNGQTIHYCSSKCEKNADLGREARDLNWTDSGRESDRQETVSDERDAAKKSAKAEADAAEAEDERDAVEEAAKAEAVEAEDEADADDESEDEETADSDEETADSDEESDSDEDTEAEEAEA